MQVVLFITVMLVDLSFTIMHVTVSVAIIQLQLSAVLIQVTTVSALNMWVIIFIGGNLCCNYAGGTFCIAQLFLF